MQQELEQRKREDFKQFEMDMLYQKHEREFGKPPPPVSKYISNH